MKTLAEVWVPSRVLAIRVLVVCALMPGVQSVAHAEGGCPPGQYPASGQGWQTCYPMPGYDQEAPQTQQAPPARWTSMWGAIALYTPKGVLGASTEKATQSEAEQAALQDCRSRGGMECKIALSYTNQCAAMVAGNPGYNVTPGASLDEAAKKGMKTCADAGDKNCHVYYSACSLPVRVQ